MGKSKKFDVGSENKKYLNKVRVKIGRDIDTYKVLNYDLNRFRGLAIYDDRDDKKNILLNKILTELDKNNDKDELEFVIVSEKPIKDIIDKNKNLKVFNIKSGTLEVIRYLESVANIRKQIFKSLEVNSLYRYNEITNKKLPTILIVFDDLDSYDQSSKQILNNFIMSTGYLFKACGFSFIFATKDFDAISSRIKTILTHEIVFKPKHNIKLRGLLYGAYPQITYSNKFYFVSNDDYLQTIDMNEIIDDKSRNKKDYPSSQMLEKFQAMEICNQKGKEFINVFENLYEDIKLYQSHENKKCNEDEIADKLCEIGINKLSYIYNCVKDIVLMDTNQQLLKGELWDWFFSAGADFRDFLKKPTYSKFKTYDNLVINLLGGKSLTECLDIIKEL